MSHERFVPGASPSARAPLGAPGPFRAEPPEPPEPDRARPRRIILLGPQRLQPTLNLAVESLGIRGPIATVTAGWEEREGEDQELSEHLAQRSFNLRIWERGEEVYQRDRALHRAVRERNETLATMQELYELRLVHLMEAAREVASREAPAGLERLFAEEVEGAIGNVRALDAEHLARIRALHVEFQERWTPWLRPEVMRHRAELERLLAQAELLCIAGGHVAVLLRRLRLFGVLDLLGRQPIIAWSAGAMAVSERIVLFHEDPPEGRGFARVHELGLGACRGVVPLPHAEKRFDLSARRRVALFARRFAPDQCVALSPRTRVDWNGERWSGASGTQRLEPSGELGEVRG